MELPRPWYSSGFGKMLLKALPFCFIVNQAAVAKMNRWDVGGCPIKQLDSETTCCSCKIAKAIQSSTTNKEERVSGEDKVMVERTGFVACVVEREYCALQLSPDEDQVTTAPSRAI